MKPFLYVFGLPVGTYGLCMLAGLTAAFFLFKTLLKRRRVRWECAMVIFACAFGVALFGAYLLYMLASVGIPTLIRAARAGLLWEVLQMGGMVFYGGVIGGVFGVLLGCRIVGLRFFPVLDLCAPALALGHAFGRVGCLFAGCCYGVPCDLPFCFALSPDIAGGARLFPVQLAESACDLLLCLALVVYLRKPRRVPRTAGIFMMSYSVYRFALEFLRYDEIRGHVFSLSTSQFISIAVFLAGLVFVFILGQRGLDPEIFRTDEGRIPD